MIFLTQRLDQGGMQLLDSLQRSGYAPQAVDMRYDGFLPDEITSPYAWYTGSMASMREGQPLYFDKLPVPRRWEIRGDSRSGGVYDYERQRARIFFAAPTNLRYVRVVDWMDEWGQVRACDHYDRFGFRFAQTVLDAAQKPVLRTYYNGAGREVILENFVTGDILLRRAGREHRFPDRRRFLLFFLQEMGWDTRHILYNSLDGPFAFSQMLGDQLGEHGEDFLFWQEGPREGVPGNMQHILAGRSSRTKHIFVQNRQGYEALLAALEEDAPAAARKPEEMLSPLGFVYGSGRAPAGSRNVLILTNSDQVEHFAELVRGLPDFTFHVAALTEMSGRLLAMERFVNVRLYPCVEPDRVEALRQTCDYYLDINRGDEILEAVYTAFITPQLIAGFSHTLHRRELVAPNHVFGQGDVAGMIRLLRGIAGDGPAFGAAIGRQRAHGMAEDAASFRKALAVFL